MEFRLLKYFYVTAEVGSVTRAASILHITQPTLSRQLAQLEAELGVSLFDRSGRKLSLTTEGMLLQRRAAEIIELVEKAEGELKDVGRDIEGTVALGCGDLRAVELLSKLVREFSEAHPHISFDIHCATADVVSERMRMGLTDVGLLLEPVDTAQFEYVNTNVSETWVAAMAPDDPLVVKDCVSPEDLASRQLILPRRTEIRGTIDHWFDSSDITPDRALTGNLSFGTATFCSSGNWIALLIEGSLENWSNEKIALRPLKPAIQATSVIAWRRDAPLSRAAVAFVEFVKDQLG